MRPRMHPCRDPYISKCNSSQSLDHHFSYNKHVLSYASPNSTPPLPPAPPPLLRLHLNLLLITLLKPPHLTTILVILPTPILHQPTDILDKPVHTAIIHPHAQHDDRAPEHEADHHVDPEHDGAIHHVEDLERHKEDGEQREDGGNIGLCYEPREERGQVGLERACYAEGGGEEGEEWVGERGGEEAGEEGCVVWRRY
jgi:hypothetical protein